MFLFDILFCTKWDVYIERWRKRLYMPISIRLFFSLIIEIIKIIMLAYKLIQIIYIYIYLKNSQRKYKRGRRLFYRKRIKTNKI